MIRETDAKVAKALGWSLRRIGRGIPPNCEGMKHPVAYPHYSTSPADAIAGLEATGQPWGLVWTAEGKYHCTVEQSRGKWMVGPTLPAAAAAAIIAWAAKGGA